MITIRYMLSNSIFLSVLLALAIIPSACKKQETETPSSEDFTLMVSVRSPLDVYYGQIVSFKVYSGLGPKTTDQVVLTLSTAPHTEVVCPITNASSSEFSWTVTDEVQSGTYKFSIRRGEVTKPIGEVEIKVRKLISIDPKEGYNVYGRVYCGDEGVSGVVVSDGVDFTTTDADGIYYLKSGEKFKLVFISTPSGYENSLKGVIPQFYSALDGNPSTTERADFELNAVEGQSKHIMYFLGDMHLANRNNDMGQFDVFEKDLKEQLAANSSSHQYIQTLGDMTWDLYWYTKSFTPADYVAKINEDFKGINIPFFHCIGNHDHEMGLPGAYPIGDYNCEVSYREAIGPNFFSYNVGDIHYVVIDDIFCTNPGDGTRTYAEQITTEQLDWLKRDLSYVSKDTPIVFITHAPIYHYTGSYQVSNSADLVSILSGYTTYFITGHTHRQYATDRLATDGNMELNSGSVCATWWWTGKLTSGLYLARDGSNGGYRVFEVDGKNVKWYYKSTGKDASVQFRTYDGNCVLLSEADVPNATANAKSAYVKAVGDWAVKNGSNYVYIEVWDYDPSWKVEVSENGKSLTPTRLTLKDPLHFLAYEAKRYDGGSEPTTSFTTYSNPNIFRVQAGSATSTIDIKVTDRFGRVYTERMSRPKAFTISEYNR